MNLEPYSSKDTSMKRINPLDVSSPWPKGSTKLCPLKILRIKFSDRNNVDLSTIVIDPENQAQRDCKRLVANKAMWEIYVKKYEQEIKNSNHIDAVIQGWDAVRRAKRDKEMNKEMLSIYRSEPTEDLDEKYRNIRKLFSTTETEISARRTVHAESLENIRQTKKATNLEKAKLIINNQEITQHYNDVKKSNAYLEQQTDQAEKELLEIRSENEQMKEKYRSEVLCLKQQIEETSQNNEKEKERSRRLSEELVHLKDISLQQNSKLEEMNTNEQILLLECTAKQFIIDECCQHEKVTPQYGLYQNEDGNIVVQIGFQKEASNNNTNELMHKENSQDLEHVETACKNMTHDEHLPNYTLDNNTEDLENFPPDDFSQNINTYMEELLERDDDDMDITLTNNITNKYTTDLTTEGTDRLVSQPIRKFKTKTNWKYVTNKRAEIFPCPVCKIKYSSKKIMLQHKGNKHPEQGSTAKEFICKKCKKNFVSKYTLQRHEIKSKRCNG